MRYIDRINSTPNQIYTVGLDTGDTFTLELRYMPTQQLWMANIAYGSKKINGIILVVGYNVLRNYKNLIPFGISITSTDGLDPYYLTDFSTQRIKLYVLTASEVSEIEATYYS